MTSDIVASALAGLGPMMMQSQRKPVDKYGARRQFGDALLMQGAQATPLRGGVAEGLARAGQAVLGGYLANRADTEQAADEEAQSKALMDAIGAAQTTGPNGQVDINLNPVAAALAKTNPTVAAYLVTMDALARRQQGQAADRTRILLGGGEPPPAGAPTDQGAIPGGPLPPPGFSGAGPGPITANNPGNMIDGRGGFQTFDSPDAGVAATIKNFQSYPAQFNGGRPMTLMQIAQRWAPADDGRNPMLRGNNPAVWARNVAAASGLPPDQPIDVSDPRVALALVRGIHVAEKGAGAAFQPDVYMRGLQMVRGQPQAAPAQPPGPTMPPPASVAAAPPEMPNPGIMPQGSGGDPPPSAGMAPGFAPTVPLAPQMRVDDGSRDLAMARQLLALNDPDSRALGMRYLQAGQAKQAQAQQFQVDIAGKEPPMLARTQDGRGIGVVEGAEEAKRRLAAAQAQGAAQGGGVLQPGVDPNTGAPGLTNPVTGEFKPSAAPFNEAQGRSATFADRMAASERNIREVEGQGTSALGAFLERIGMGGNYLQTPEYQRYEQARRDFINAQLRRESGAVISPDEFANAEKQYFPRPGDSPQVIEQKRRNREIAVAGMQRDAGPAYKPRQDAPQGGIPALQQARDAIAKGAPRDKVIERLRSMGIDPGGL